MLRATISSYLLKFLFIAHTSRESFTQKKTYFVKLFDEECPDIYGVGEVAVFPSLQPSFTSFSDFEEELSHIAHHINDYIINNRSFPCNSAIRFGFESAQNDLKRKITNCQQNYAKSGIPINGLIWLNDIETMQKEIDKKIKDGFRCLKIKIGAKDFKEEFALLKSIRSNYPASELELRVDANGAFSDIEVMNKLDSLSSLDLHSIEQPLPRNSPATKDLCKYSPVPIALDEDMIERWWPEEQKIDWLSQINPSYIVIKPSLIGGFSMADEWIRISRMLNIGWWVTSALESTVGLSAIARWLAQYSESETIYHGLGTGQIYANNLPGDINLSGERLCIVE